ncbi:MAG TPA: histidine kinase dimerization/phospho-acceptor domain-containing protein [Anaeromyxobacter sp.]|nr:histidine kinase dimerization/phospho-acceptor domain-containing protein [Anaeromyxobacter sp.]
MYPFAAGAAILDVTGAVVASDDGFRALLGLPDGDAGGALRARAEVDPALRAFVSGEGPATLSLAGAGGLGLELERVADGARALVVARAASLGEALEHALRSVALGRVAAGLVHDIKNPLNAMALQVALLGEKLSATPDAAAAAAGHLSALRDQVGRVNEILRRFLDVADPGAPLGYTDVGALLADVAALLGHEGRRRRIEVTVEAPAGAIRTACDPARVGRLVLGIFARALAETPDGGRLGARATADAADVTIGIEHATGALDPDLGYYTEAAVAGARLLGGALAEERGDGVARITLALPRGEGQ